MLFFLVTIAYDLILLLINTGENVTFLRLTIATTNRRDITLVNIDLPFILQIRPYQENVNIFCKKNCIGMSKKKTQRVWLVDKIEDQIWSGDTGCPAHFAHAYILMYDHWRVNHVIWFMI